MQEESAMLIPKIDTEPKDENNQDVVKVSKKPRIKKIYIWLPVTLLIIILAFLIPSLFFYQKVQSVYKNLEPVITNNELTDVDKFKSDFEIAKNSVIELKNSYKIISWMKFTPILGKYIDDLGNGLEGAKYLVDAGDSAFVALGPLLDELGFTDGEVGTSEKSAQERIDFVVNSIPELLPKLDIIIENVKKAESKFDEINPNDYPEMFNGILVREKIKNGLEMFNKVSEYIISSKPILESAPYLLGVDEQKEYFVLFQNDKELRPTGGFLTAYSVMNVKNAKFEPVTSDDIYTLDSKYKPNLPAPQPIVDLIKGPYILSKNIRLRDLNYSPDFKEAMNLFTSEASNLGLDEVDGIIAVDTHLLVNILDVIGEIGVPGFGNFSTKTDPRCNCPQVIYELESFADVEGPIIWDPLTGKIILRPPNSDNRKKIIGPLMNSILANSLAQPKEKIPDLINAIFKSLSEKHVLFYMYDQTVQKAVEDFGIAGTIERNYGGDYLHISDSNLGGRKSNLYAKSEVEQDISINKEGIIEKTVVIKYKNSEKHDGWLNSVLPNWVRVYVPKGSKLIEVTGLEKQYQIAEDLNKTVFSGYFSLRPEGVSTLTFKYSLPFKKGQDDMKMLIQKQPGTDAILYTVRSLKSEEEFLLNTDKEIKVKL